MIGAMPDLLPMLILCAVGLGAGVLGGVIGFGATILLMPPKVHFNPRTIELTLGSFLLLMIPIRRWLRHPARLADWRFRARRLHFVQTAGA